MNFTAVTIAGAEQTVVEAVRAMGGTAYAPQVVAFERRGTNRRPETYFDPVLPRLVFIREKGNSQVYYETANLREVKRCDLQFGDMVWGRYITPWVAQCEAAKRDMLERIRTREIVDQYVPGEKLTMRDGAFKDRVLEFRRAVTSGEGFPVLELSADLPGLGHVKVEADPLLVQKAG